MAKIDMGDFVQYLRQNPLDKFMGISPEQRGAMDAEREEREKREDAIAIHAMKGLTGEQIDCLYEYFTREYNG